MKVTTRRQLRRPNMRRAVILFPSGLTLGNLFFGVFAIIAASRGQFVQAGVFVLLGGACDALDGQVARATNAGTQFGEELDSLVDAITFGLAPGLIMYFAVLNRDNWDWLVVFLFAACAVMRLARFNIEQAGTAKTYFQGLPSPAAGITLASYYWFSQSWLYNYGAIADLPWHVLLRYLMAALAFLMISNIPYPVFPRTGFRSLRAIGATFLLVGSIALLLTRKLEFFFPFALCYVAWGPIRWVFSGLFERRQPTIPYDLSEGEDDEEEDEEDALGPMDSQVHASRQSERVARPPRTERTERGDRAGRERTEPAARSPRAERSARTESAAAQPVKVERVESADRGARPDRGERPERTEAERAARREKREKRDKRRERGPRADAAAPEAAAETGVTAITLGEAPTEVLGVPALSVVRTESDGSLPEEPVDGMITDGGTPRKRKRRRRRGQRDRVAGDPLGIDEASEGSEGDEGGEDSQPDEPSGPGRAQAAPPRPVASDPTERSPYAAPASAPEPPPIPSATPSPSAPPAPVIVPPHPLEPSE